MIELTSKQRKNLEKLAHNLNPIVIIGGAGLTEGVTNMVASSLEAHELLKIKFNEYKDEKKELITEVCQQLDASLVRIIGNVAILFRPAPEEDDRKISY